MLRIRDFIETAEGLIFAVVSYHHPGGRYLAYLRYYPSPSGGRVREGRKYAKVSSTRESAGYLRANHPSYIDDAGQYVPRERVKEVYRPVDRLREILRRPEGGLEQKVAELSTLFSKIPEKKKGVTGSILVGLHGVGSDIDFVVYGCKNHIRGRNILRDLIGSGKVEELTGEQWRQIFEKRFPGGKALSYEEFLWHEKRKYHRGSIGGTIFDILLVRDEKVVGKEERAFRDLGKVKVTARIIDASLAFDSPAVYQVKFDDGSRGWIYSYTHTYAGQAFEGELVKACGVLQRAVNSSELRLVVGSTREAEGEYIKVVKGP